MGAAGKKKGKNTKEEKKNSKKKKPYRVFWPSKRLRSHPIADGVFPWTRPLSASGPHYRASVGRTAGWPPKYLVIVLAPRNTPVSLACDTATCARSRARLDPPESAPRRGTPAMLRLAWSPGRALLLRAQRPHIQTENRRALSHPAPHAAIRGSRLFHRIASCTAAYPCATVQFPKKINSGEHEKRLFCSTCP